MADQDVINELRDIWGLIIKYNQHIQGGGIYDGSGLENEFHKIVNSDDVIKK